MLFLEAFHVFRLRVSDCCKVFERYSKRFKVGLRTLQAILEHLSFKSKIQIKFDVFSGIGTRDVTMFGAKKKIFFQIKSCFGALLKPVRNKLQP